jgi:hypothetical protein
VQIPLVEDKTLQLLQIQDGCREQANNQTVRAGSLDGIPGKLYGGSGGGDRCLWLELWLQSDIKRLSHPHPPSTTIALLHPHTKPSTGTFP